MSFDGVRDNFNDIDNMIGLNSLRLTDDPKGWREYRHSDNTVSKRRSSLIVDRHHHKVFGDLVNGGELHFGLIGFFVISDIPLEGDDTGDIVSSTKIYMAWCKGENVKKQMYLYDMVTDRVLYSKYPADHDDVVKNVLNRRINVYEFVHEVIYTHFKSKKK